MASAALAETLTVQYDQLGSDVHRAVGRILTAWADSSFRVDDIEPQQLDGIRGILQAAEGERLPRYHYDEAGNYVQMGKTPVVEERHTRVAMADHLQQGGDSKSLWLKVPRYSIERESEESQVEPQKFTKKDFAIFGAGGLAVNGLVGAGIAANKPGLAAAGFLVDLPLMAYGVRRISQVIPPLSERPAQ